MEVINDLLTKKPAMKNTSFSDNWNAVKRKIQDAYPDLTVADLKYEEGKEEELLKNLENKTGR
jgi:hypothetical protein